MSKSDSVDSGVEEAEEVDAVEEIDLEEESKSINDIDVDIDDEFIAGPDTY
jgi:hypothetical protein